jgi:hypothetical protein
MVIVRGAAVAVTVLTVVLTWVLGADDGVLLQPANASPIDAAAMTRVIDMLGSF